MYVHLSFSSHFLCSSLLLSLSSPQKRGPRIGLLWLLLARAGGPLPSGPLGGPPNYHFPVCLGGGPPSLWVFCVLMEGAVLDSSGAPSPGPADEGAPGALPPTSASAGTAAGAETASEGGRGPEGPVASPSPSPGASSSGVSPPSMSHAREDSCLAWGGEDAAVVASWLQQERIQGVYRLLVESLLTPTPKTNAGT